MIEQYPDLFEAALALPEGARSELADRLIISLTPPHGDENLEAVIGRRLQEVEGGAAETISAEDAMLSIRDRLAAARRR